VYAVAQFHDGYKDREVMAKWEVEDVKSSSKSKSKAIWNKWYGEMAKKSVTRRMCKRLSVNNSKFKKALEIDNKSYDLNGVEPFKPGKDIKTPNDAEKEAKKKAEESFADQIAEQIDDNASKRCLRCGMTDKKLNAQGYCRSCQIVLNKEKKRKEQEEDKKHADSNLCNTCDLNKKCIIAQSQSSDSSIISCEDYKEQSKKQPVRTKEDSNKATKHAKDISEGTEAKDLEPTGLKFTKDLYETMKVNEATLAQVRDIKALVEKNPKECLEVLKKMKRELSTLKSYKDGESRWQDEFADFIDWVYEEIQPDGSLY
jgi:hypothetical protein